MTQTDIRAALNRADFNYTSLAQLLTDLTKMRYTQQEVRSTLARWAGKDGVAIGKAAIILKAASIIAGTPVCPAAKRLFPRPFCAPPQAYKEAA